MQLPLTNEIEIAGALAKEFEDTYIKTIAGVEQ